MLKWTLAVLFLSVPASGADLTAGMTTKAGERYNQRYRDFQDGTKAETVDCVDAYSAAQFAGTANTVKSSGGILHHLTLNTACANGNLIVADAAAATSASYAVVVATIPLVTTTVVPLVIPFDAVFSNGIAFNVPYATCTVTAVWR